jgi:hypothetical protein
MPTERRGDGLTGGEIACIRLIVAGKNDAKIAAALGIAPSTAHGRIEQAKKRPAGALPGRAWRRLAPFYTTPERNSEPGGLSSEAG